MDLQVHQQNMQKALQLFQSSRLQEAKTLLEKITGSVRHDPGAWHMLGAVQRRSGDFFDSTKSLNKSIQLNHVQPDVWNTLGIVHRNTGCHSEALACYDTALKLSPDHVDALNNKGLILNQMKRWPEAESAFKRAINLSSDNPTAMIGYAESLKAQHKDQEALDVYDVLLKKAPQNVIALNNKSTILKLQGKWKLAIECLKVAMILAPESNEVRHNLASAYAGDGQEDEAIKLYRKIIDNTPDDVSAHRFLNQILWTQNSHDFLNSYHHGKKINPVDVELRKSYAGQLMQAERLEEAQAEIKQAIEIEPNRHDLRVVHGQILKENLRFEEALAELVKADGLKPDDPNILEKLGETYLGMGDGKAALSLFARLLKTDNENITWWSLKADALRLMGSDEYRWLYDYDQLVSVRMIDTPKGYKNVSEFNQALLHDLQQFHIGRQHPLDQSLRTGTQTVGKIFDAPCRTIQQLKQAMSEQVWDFLKGLPKDNQHPTLRNKSLDFDFIGSWSVRLKKDGFHANHFHSEGWFSGPYYVSLPDVVKAKGNDQGYVKFGEPGYAAQEPLPPELIVAPAEGAMVLFPSYMWHGTVPFESHQYRVCVAQDLVQKLN